jgi:hypothetical protein
MHLSILTQDELLTGVDDHFSLIRVGCQFEWIDEEICLANKAQAMGQIYFPDYKTNTCRNDGMHSAYEDNFFTSYENCCSFEFIDYDICMAGEGEVMEQQSQGVGGGRSVYYPD